MDSGFAHVTGSGVTSSVERLAVYCAAVGSIKQGNEP
jgi:hypothetical protein